MNEAKPTMDVNDCGLAWIVKPRRFCAALLQGVRSASIPVDAIIKLSWPTTLETFSMSRVAAKHKATLDVWQEETESKDYSKEHMAPHHRDVEHET